MVCAQLTPTDTPIFGFITGDLRSALEAAHDNRPELGRLSLQNDINRSTSVLQQSDQAADRSDRRADYYGLAGTAGDLYRHELSDRVRPTCSAVTDRTSPTCSSSRRGKLTLAFQFSFRCTTGRRKPMWPRPKFRKNSLMLLIDLRIRPIEMDVRNAAQSVDTAPEANSRCARSRAKAPSSSLPASRSFTMWVAQPLSCCCNDRPS